MSLIAQSIAGGGLALAPARCAAPTMQYRKAGWFPGTFAPSYLDGSLPGDVGFDPASMVALARTNLKADEENPWADGNFESKIQLVMMSDYVVKRKLAWMREAEIKHARLAMLAAAGWPLSEMLDGPLSSLLGVPNALAAGGRAPSLFNGGLFEGPQGLFLGLVTLATDYLELNTLDNVEGLTPTGYIAGDLGFDPLGLMDKRADMATAEIKNGRLAMLAITGMAVQEFIYGTPVIQQTPQYFKPFFL